MSRLCSSCEQEISAKRIKAKPSANLCVSCQEEVERNTPKPEEPVAYISREKLHSKMLASVRETPKFEYIKLQGDDLL